MNENKDRVKNAEDVYYIIGGVSDYTPSEESDTSKKRLPWWPWIVIFMVVLICVFFVVYSLSKNHIFESESVAQCAIKKELFSGMSESKDIWLNNTAKSLPPCTISLDTLVDGVHLKILTPYNSVPELYVGNPDTSDNDIVFATLAADVRSDNGKIVGAFVYAGEPLSWGGGRKWGFCAIIDENITFGVAENSPLFEQATEMEGYFFRQYPAVQNGVAMKNNPKNASFRRALCMLNGKVCIVASFDRVQMNDFSEILVKLGVQNAIFLVGTAADGWYRPEDGSFHRLGEKYIKGNNNINYIVFRAQ